MRQVVTVSPGQVEVAETPDPTPGPGEVTVAVDAAGICGSDVHIYRGRHPYQIFPMVQGHEIAGHVIGLGPGTGGPSLGTAVVVEPVISCGHCFACGQGHYNACPNLELVGIHRPGGFADLLVVPANRVHPTPDLPPDLAVLSEPVAVGLQAVARAGLSRGDDVAVIGAGCIGRAITMAAADRGARVLIADREPARLRLAERLGASRAVSTRTQDLDAATSRFTNGNGPRVVIDATGVPAMIRLALELVAPSGTVVVVGLSDEEVSVPVGIFTRKELNVLGSRNSADLFGQAIDVVRRHRTVVGELISHRFPLAAAGEALALVADNAAVVSKAIIEPRRRALAGHRHG
jgi:threonine dehydrogenase-like Zn-dependent dehydrogenase